MQHEHAGLPARRLAIIGSGISGLGAAYALRKKCHIELFEQSDRVGGHIRPRTVTDGSGEETVIDTAFLGFKPEVYPAATELFQALGVETVPADITGSIHRFEHGFHFLRHETQSLFGKELPAEWARPSRTFFASLIRALKDGYDQLPNERIDDYLAQAGFPKAMVDTLVLPDVASIWGVQPEEAAAMSVHGAVGSLLTVGRGVHRLKHSTADYLSKLLQACDIQTVHRNCSNLAVVANERGGASVICNGQVHQFDKVLIATSAERALGLLAQPTDAQKKTLSKFNYVSTVAVLHRDPSLLQPLAACRGHFNYVESKKAVTITWDMNALLGLSDLDPIQITTSAPSLLGTGAISEAKVLDVAYHRHCIQTPLSVSAIVEMNEMNKCGPVHFSGSYFSPAATHEAALQSALRVSNILLEGL